MAIYMLLNQQHAPVAGVQPQGTVELLSFSFGVARLIPRTGSAGAGRVNPDVTCTLSHVNMSLLRAWMSGETYNAITIWTETGGAIQRTVHLTGSLVAFFAQTDGTPFTVVLHPNDIRLATAFG